MPLDNIPENAAELAAKSKADVQRELQESNPYGKNHWLGAVVVACAHRVFDFYLQLNVAVKQNFLDTATGAALIRWAGIYGKQLIPASQANGLVVATGVAGSLIPADTIMSASGVGSYVATSSATISAQTINIQSLTLTGSVVTAITESNHTLANGVSVAIAGASESEYNVTAQIFVNGNDSFQYSIVGSPADEPTTSATASFTTTCVPVISNDFGQDFNLDSGAILRLQSPLVGVDDSLTVDFGAIGGGTNKETDEGLRARTSERLHNPIAFFNPSVISEKAKEIAGVTRVFVQSTTPSLGRVTVYFMRDNDLSPIPSGSEVTKVKNSLLEIKPVEIQDSDLIVSAPVAEVVDFVFASLTPDTTTMRQSVENSLGQFFDEQIGVEQNVDEDAYRAAIFNTIDIATGQTVSTFDLSSPSGDIAVGVGGIGTLGAISYL